MLRRLNLADAHLASGEFDEARACCDEVLAITRRSYGRDGGPTWSGRECLARVHMATGAHAAALAERTQILAIWERALGRDGPAVADSRERLAQVYEAMHTYDAARELHGRALATFHKIHGGDHLQGAASLVGLARLDLAAGKPRAALASLERAVKIYEHFEGAQDQEWSARFHLARALVATHGAQARALREATRARDGLRAANRADEAGLLAQVDAWLVEHGAARTGR